MNGETGIELLEIKDSNLKPIEDVKKSEEEFTKIPVLHGNLDYSQFFESFLLPNKPCLIQNVSQNWPCSTKWIENKSLNLDYLRANYRNVEVPISNCEKREFNVQQKCTMKLFEYLDYWKEYQTRTKLMDCLYLKDWHFVKEFPQEDLYRVPSYFASDWLNEYYDNNPQLNDDYRFIYIGPKGSWTPFHADVFTSYSWSVNICGLKKWILIPPGREHHFRDNLGNLNYNIDLPKVEGKGGEEELPVVEVIQEEGQGLFVPSGWHHQVWNLEDTVSINHNWINGCNVHYVWESLQKNLSDVMKEISDCKDMENWASQCQLVLSASFGFNYQFFHSFLVEIAKLRIKALKERKNISVYGNWSFGENHMLFDLKRIRTVLESVEKDENFLEIAESENELLEFRESLNAFLESDNF